MVSLSGKILVTLLSVLLTLSDLLGLVVVAETSDESCAESVLRVHHIRSATFVLDIGNEKLLVDPMFFGQGELKGLPGVSGLKVLGSEGKKNPLTPLPTNTNDMLESVTGVLITHVHPDHLDDPAKAWIKERNLPVWTSAYDVDYLKGKGLDAREIKAGSLGLRVEVIPCQHGRGFVGWAAGVGVGFFLQAPGQASIYITGDTVITPEVTDVISRLSPDVIVAPAGSANFGFGSDLIFTVEELKQLGHLAPGKIVYNHLEALDHCPNSRDFIRSIVKAEGLESKSFVPDDGESLTFRAPDSAKPDPQLVERHLSGGFQKWFMTLTVDL